MKRILIIYNSGAGSTKTIAEVYYSLLSEYRIDIMPVKTPFDYSVLNGYDLIIFGFPCYHCDLSGLMKDFVNKMRLFAISLFDRHLIDRKSRIGNDLETSEVLRSA